MQFLQAYKQQPRRRANGHLSPLRFGHPYRQVRQCVIGLFDQIAITSKDALAMKYQYFASRTRMKAVVNLDFGRVLMRSM